MEPYKYSKNLNLISTSRVLGWGVIYPASVLSIRDITSASTVRRHVVPHAGARGNTHRSVYQGHSPKTCGATRRSAWQYTPECVSGPQSEDMWRHTPERVAIHTGVCIRATVRRHVAPHAGARGNTHRSVYRGHSPETCGATRRSAWQYTPECVSGPQSEDMWRHTPERVAIHTGVCIRATVRRHVAPHAGACGRLSLYCRARVY